MIKESKAQSAELGNRKQNAECRGQRLATRSQKLVTSNKKPELLPDFFNHQQKSIFGNNSDLASFFNY